MSVINPDLGPDPVHGLADGSRRDRPLSRYELHNIYREMVRWELSNGRLSAWRRRKLVQYAASMRLSAVEAGELIQEAIRASLQEAADDERDQLSLGRTQVDQVDEASWPRWAKLSLALVAVVLVQAALAAIFVG